MKKTLLALFSVFCSVAAMNAADIVADFAQLEATAADQKQVDKTVTTGEGESLLTWNLPAKTYINTGYVFITAGAEISTTVPIKVAAIKVMTSNSCSTNAGNTITIKLGDKEVVTSEKVNALNTPYEWSIPAADRAEGATYTFVASGSKNPQFAKIIFVEETTAPTLSIAQTEIPFASVLNGTDTQTVKILSENVTGSIALSVDNPDFAVPATVTPAEAAEGVEVTFTGKTPGNATATLTVKAGATTATVALTSLTVGHEGTEASPLSVADVLALNNINKGPFYVTGKISQYCGANAKNGVLQTSETLVASNIVLEDEDANLIGVALPTGTTRAKLNIVDNPGNVGLTVVVKGTLENYFSAPGVKNAEYVSGLPEAEAEKVANIAAFLEKADTKAPCIIEGDVTAVYVNGKYLYVKDNSGSLCIYGNEWTYEAGDVIPGGFQGTYSVYNGLGQMSDPSGFEAATKGEASAPEVVNMADITIADAYKYVTIEGVNISASGNNLTFSVAGGATFPGYNTFKLELPEFDAETAYNVTGIVGAYQGNPQILVTEIVVDPNSGISAIAADDATAPAEYFNLQGQRVANPESGLYIIRQGSKVAKVIIR